ncbi:MAG: flagellar motor switch protein FliG [bacterium]
MTGLAGLHGPTKAAVLLLSLPTEISSQIIRFLGEDDVALLGQAMAAVGPVPPEAAETVLDEFAAQTSGGGAGYGQVRELLERALGQQRARDLMDRVVQPNRVTPFDRMRQAPAEQVAALLQEEHPQVAAIALAHLRSEQAAQVLQHLPNDRKADVARRIAQAQPVSPEILRRVEHALERRLMVVVPHRETTDGAATGMRTLADIIARTDRETERAVLGSLQEADPQLAEEIKGLLFVFDDLMAMKDVTLQRVLRDVDQKVLATALKGTTEDLRERIFRNLSSGAQEVVKEEMDLMGPVPVRDVEDARRTVVSAVRQLEEAGEITISREGEEQLVV